MKLVRVLVVILVVLSSFISLKAQALKITVEDITANPGKFSGNAVQIEGIAEQYVKATPTTTSYYLLKGSYGGIVKVNTFGEPPVINKKYEVVGIVYIDPVNREPFVSEKSKTLLEKVPSERIVIKEKDSYLFYLLGFFIILLIALVILIIYQKNAGAKKQAFVPEQSSVPNLQKPIEEQPQKSVVMSEPKTVKITAPPKTMKFIPGHLEIISGEDKGKTFKIAGYPTADGTVITIGRKKITGDRAFAHIHLGDKYNTVSREQAEIIDKNNTLYIKNISSTNYTQIDGKELLPNAMAELKEGSTIRMGELELKYKK